ncbi:MAG: UDP-N-acetylmuramate dehydrogenase [Ruminococcus sp.]|nr:UDP-N-acetylmuramate dehydrogenase [Ruminococcus sp.]
MEKFINFLKEADINYKLDEPMKNHTTFKVGGNAEVFVTVNNNSELLSVLNYVENNNIVHFIIGKGSNLLVSDDGIKGAVITLSGEFNEIKLIDENTVTAGAGVPLIKLCSFALENGLSGLEFAYGIPGSVGGAVFMNAGAYGGEIKDVIVTAQSVKDGKTEDIAVENLGLGYRTSVFKTNDSVITNATFRLHKADKAEIKTKMNELMGRRKDKQPLEYPSAGSTFKRPQGAFAGTLIESCGLKGYSVGDAQVSSKHAGFVINKGNTTAAEINELINHIQKKVLEETGYFLETEVIRL